CPPAAGPAPPPRGAPGGASAFRRGRAAQKGEWGGVSPPVSLHMGINTGEALVGATKLGGTGGQRWTFTASGSTTNIAARFAAFAQGGDIVVGPATAERIRQHFVLESLGEQTFKNVSHPIRVYRVIPPGVYEKIVCPRPSASASARGRIPRSSSPAASILASRCRRRRGCASTPRCSTSSR